MTAPYSRADSLREYLTGASSDGAAQTNPLLSFGNFRSASECLTYGITIASGLTGVQVLFASGSNPPGDGQLVSSPDGMSLTWQVSSASGPGPSVFFSTLNDTEIVEAQDMPGAYLRIKGSPPFSVGSSTITLTYLVDNIFGFDDVPFTLAASGESQYRATMLRNEGSNSIISLKRWISLLGTPQVSNGNQLGASGSGTIVTTGNFSDWPDSGWCQVRDSGGTLREVVYYTNKTNTTLTISATGRALLGSTSAAGLTTDVVYPVPGVAIATDSAEIQNQGTSIQTIANATTAPTGVTWNLGITEATGLNIGSLAVGKQVGIWYWRQIPPGTVSSPLVLNKFSTSFGAI